MVNDGLIMVICYDFDGLMMAISMVICYIYVVSTVLTWLRIVNR